MDKLQQLLKCGTVVNLDKILSVSDVRTPGNRQTEVIIASWEKQSVTIMASNVKLIDTRTDACNCRSRTHSATQRVKTCTGNIDALSSSSSSSSSVIAPDDRPTLFTVLVHLPAALHRASLSKKSMQQTENSQSVSLVFSNVATFSNQREKMCFKCRERLIAV